MYKIYTTMVNLVYVGL